MEGDIDWDTLITLVEWHIEAGTDAIVALGTTGESATLTKEERSEVLKQVILVVNKRIPVIAGTGTNSTQESVHLTAEAKALGADAVLLVVPYYNCPSQEGLYQHFLSVADAVAIPQILYNVPGRTVTDLLPETVVRLMEHKNIIGIKDATGEMERAKLMLDAAKDKDFALYSGDDGTSLQFLQLGGQGIISVTANVAPQMLHNLCDAVLNSNDDKAKLIDQQLSQLNSALFIEANPIPVKWALSEMKKIKKGIRLPLTPLSLVSQKVVRNALNSAGLMVAETI